MPRVTIRREELRRSPNLIWTTAVEQLTACPDWKTLQPSQRVAWLALHYDADVTTGGHAKFFDRADPARVAATREALEALGGSAQLRVLDMACTVSGGEGASTSPDVGRQLDAIDLAYHAINPDVQELVASWLNERVTDFVDLVD